MSPPAASSSSAPGYTANLIPSWIPALDGVQDKLWLAPRSPTSAADSVARDTAPCPGRPRSGKPQVVGVPSLSARRQTAVMDTISQNKNTVTSFIDALFTKGDLGAVDEFLAENFVNHDPPVGVTADREGMRQAGAMFRAAFPDWHSDTGILVAEDNLVVEPFTASGTQQGEIFGVPASGRAVSLPGINIWRVRDGRIVERWGRLDELGLLRQLGLVPAS